jgi:serine/threonine-protein kinase
MPEQQVGDFLLEAKLGEGGMGVVFRARQVSLDRPVALKFLSHHASLGRQFAERFNREARAAAQLVHPNIIQIYVIGEHEGTPYFAMEYVEGLDLSHLLLGGGPLRHEEALEVIRSVAKALEMAAERGIVHRDIKPANIMITRSGLAKVMDFGLAKATAAIQQSLTQEGQIVGTPTYLSPEQGLSKDVDTRSDLYSLGCVLYECLAGRPPFQADNVAALIFKHLYEAPAPPSQVQKKVPKAIAAICLKLLAKDPKDRYQSPTELLKALATVPSNTVLAETQLGERVRARLGPARGLAAPSAVPEPATPPARPPTGQVTIIAPFQAPRPAPVPSDAALDETQLGERLRARPGATRGPAAPSGAPKPATPPARPPTGQATMDAPVHAPRPAPITAPAEEEPGIPVPADESRVASPTPFDATQRPGQVTMIVSPAGELIAPVPPPPTAAPAAPPTPLPAPAARRALLPAPAAPRTTLPAPAAPRTAVALTPERRTPTPENNRCPAAQELAAGRFGHGVYWYFKRMADGRWGYDARQGHCALAEGLASEKLPGADSQVGSLGDCLICSNWTSRFGCAIAATKELPRTTLAQGLALLEEIAAVWCAAGRFDKAIPVVEDYLKKHPGDAAGFRALARIYDRPDYDGKDRARAVVLYNRFLELANAREDRFSTLEIRLARERMDSLRAGRAPFRKKSDLQNLNKLPGVLQAFRCFYRADHELFFAFGVLSRQDLRLAKAGSVDPELGISVEDLKPTELHTFFRRKKDAQVKAEERAAAEKELERLVQTPIEQWDQEASRSVTLPLNEVLEVGYATDVAAKSRTVCVATSAARHELVFPAPVAQEAERCALLLKRLTGK